MDNQLQGPSPVVLTRASAAQGTYKPLPAELRKNGFDLNLVERQKDVAIYQKRKDQYEAGYEVIVIRNKEAYEIAGNYIEAAEYYPGNEDWGTYGFTYCDYRQAHRKFCNLIRARSGKRSTLENDRPR